ncbi:hypothetical protein AUC70_03275 [Methyloceanibacter stevinii]|uniref:Glycosyltransferase 2-like domain-containing protein n=1 Tax=Methyloceanibacter stevinii TaxID=1774970 RepID=A0A1E3VQU7_9HYPH|nr:glycosyltransferase [Methyloceanibacter stevinii]ODR95892.1 hypothetical protein AUC70_03275 [Methyloceanibacter stevinii]
MPQVSIIMISFNHGAYIQESIDSVLNQTFSDFELIIWDDASQDESWKLICNYRDPRIRAFRNNERRRGIYGLNRAISEIALGEFIAIHHSDDVWEPQKLEKQVAFLREHKRVGAVFTTALAIGEDGMPFSGDHAYLTIFEQPNRTRFEWLRFFFLSGNCLCHPSVLIRKVCYGDCGPYRYGFAQLGDFDMWVRLCLKYEIHILSEKLVKFRIRDAAANASASRPDTRIRCNYEYYRILWNYLDIKEYRDFIQIFPESSAYCDDQNFDLPYALAMVCLQLQPASFRSLFAQDILFQILTNEVSAKQLSERVGFDYRDFVALSGRNDVFSSEHFGIVELL